MLAAQGAALSAQRAPRIEVAAPPQNVSSEQGPVVSSAGLLADKAMSDLLSNGFPARMHYRLERWAVGRWFDDLKAASEWDVLVKYDALARNYEIFRVINEEAMPLGKYPTLEEAAALAESPFRPVVPLPRKGLRTYYNLLLDVEMLSLSDLDEVERWLRGELKPAVRGKKNPGTAVTRGMRTLVVRLLGGEKRHYEARSGTFKP